MAALIPSAACEIHECCCCGGASKIYTPPPTVCLPWGALKSRGRSRGAAGGWGRIDRMLLYRGPTACDTLRGQIHQHAGAGYAGLQKGTAGVADCQRSWVVERGLFNSEAVPAKSRISSQRVDEIDKKRLLFTK